MTTNQRTDKEKQLIKAKIPMFGHTLQSNNPSVSLFMSYVRI